MDLSIQWSIDAIPPKTIVDKRHFCLKIGMINDLSSTDEIQLEYVIQFRLETASKKIVALMFLYKYWHLVVDAIIFLQK